MELEDQIQEWLEQLEVLGEREPGFRYPPAMVERALGLVRQLRAAGYTQQAIATCLQVPWCTLRRWSRSQKSHKPTFHALQMSAQSSTLSLVTPQGFRLEGLDVPTALELLRSLS